MRKQEQEWKRRMRPELEELFARLPSLPKNLEKWILEKPMQSSRYLFVRQLATARQGLRRAAYCTHCGRDGAVGEEVRGTKHNDPMKCPWCGSAVWRKDDGRGRGALIDTAYIYVAQAMPPKDGGVFIRTFIVKRDYSGDFIQSYRCCK